jgi:hypothetical protein
MGLILKGTHDTLSKGWGFLVKLPRDWKITALRTSIYKFFYQMLLPYISIYTIALGATATQLGMVNSIGMGAAGVLGPSPAGSLIGSAPKKFTWPESASWRFPICLTAWPRAGRLLSLPC